MDFKYAADAHLLLPPEWPRSPRCGWRWPWTGFEGPEGHVARTASSPSRSFPAIFEARGRNKKEALKDFATFISTLAFAC